jgi:hypothetical protein
VVVTFQLEPLDEVDYLALSAGEDLFVHSFGGRRYLFPAPARFVNHSDDPSCYQDFDGSCDIALRPIAAGEPITIDANGETAVAGSDPLCSAVEPIVRHGSSAAEVSRTTAVTAIAVRGLVAAASSPPATMQAGWTTFDPTDQAVAIRVM